MQQIQASKGVFAAMLSDGSVVTWGNAFHGGDSSAVQDQLRDVQQIQASNGAFAAILGDGSVVTWGDAGWGGDSSADRISCEMCSRSKRPIMGHSLQSGAMDPWSPGVMPTMVATAVRYRISCEMCSRSKRPMAHSLQSWAMDLWSPGVMPAGVATAVRCRISCEKCSRFKVLVRHLLQSWLMDLWSPGATPSLAPTALRCSISCVMCSSVEAFLPNSEKLLTIPWLPRGAVGISLSHFASLLTCSLQLLLLSNAALV